MNKKYLYKEQEELKKIFKLTLPNSKVRTEKDRPSNFEKKLELHKLNTANDIIEFLREYSHLSNYKDILDFVARRVYQYKTSFFSERVLGEFDYVEHINDKIAPQDIIIDGMKFDVKLTVVPKKNRFLIEDNLEKFRNINSANYSAIRQVIAKTLIEGATNQDYEEGKIFIVIYSKDENHRKELYARANTLALYKKIRKELNDYEKFKSKLFYVDEVLEDKKYSIPCLMIPLIIK